MAITQEQENYIRECVATSRLVNYRTFCVMLLATLDELRKGPAAATNDAYANLFLETQRQLADLKSEHKALQGDRRRDLELIKKLENELATARAVVPQGGVPGGV